MSLAGHLQELVELLRGCIGEDADADAKQFGQGVYVTDADVARALAELSWTAQGPTPPDEQDRIARLAEVLELSSLETLAFVAAVAPEVDRSFGTIYAYLNDDVGLRRATFSLVQRLARVDPLDPSCFDLLGIDGRLSRLGLIVPDADESITLPRRQFRVPGRVIGHLLGDDSPVAQLARRMIVATPISSPEAVEAAKTLVGNGPALIYVRETQPGTALAHAAGIVEAAGGVALAVDFDDVVDEGPALAREALREALLNQCCLVVGSLDAVIERDRSVLDVIIESPVPVIGTGRHMWPQDRPAMVPLLIDAPEVSAEARGEVWMTEVPDASDDLVAAVAKFRIPPERIPAAARAAMLDASRRSVPFDAAAAHHAIRIQNTGELDRLARRITPRAALDDLVLPPELRGQVAEIARWVANRDTVEDTWAMGGKGTKGRGITALFAGRSGTGKTLTAEIVAGEIGVDMYTIDLATVVSKYIGETEKNLERVFAGAEGVNAVLFFDEADALFGKRSETSDAHDRYANIEVSYLLQRMEQFDGISILATNLRTNIDEAFARRLDFVLTFPFPDAAARRRLWDVHLPAGLPLADDIETGELAERFELAGGDIRNATLAAAYAAADDGRPVEMGDLVRAVSREYQKLGRLVTEDDFGPWAKSVEPER